ncbi:hypothetical protein [Caudoviricetes sp.]|nr:hypothetical protein [Caudoviricetes sp.]UOF79141.1 hypothetical protein [Caudoviricetes sp.]
MATISNVSLGITPTSYNTENSLALPQGSQTSTALPSSISSIITSLLYQSSKKPSNYWSGFFTSSTPTTTAAPSNTAASFSAPITSGNVTNYGDRDHTNTTTSTSRISGGTSSRTTNTNNYTTGGTIKLSDGKYYTVLGLASEVGSGANGQKTYTTTGSDGKKYRITLGPNSGRTPVTAPTNTNTNTGGTGGVTANPVYNIGNPMQAYTLQALQIADAYFSPKRLELAYELEQMDVDMRRLAVNLGRQIDDPILQAKLYKEAMQQTRQLDNDQSVFALQMVEQRRSEEMANRQFYDQLALEGEKVKAASEQFFASLNLQRGQTEYANQQFYASLSLQNAMFEWQKQKDAAAAAAAAEEAKKEPAPAPSGSGSGSSSGSGG